MLKGLDKLMKRDIAIIVQKLKGGGAERTAANLSIALSEYYNVHLIVFDGKEIKYPYGGTLHDVKIPPKDNYIAKIVNVFKRSRAVNRIKKKEGIVSSISLMDGANLVNVLSKSGDIVITSVRNQMSQIRFKNKLNRFLLCLQMRFISRRSKYIVALSKGVEEDLIQNFGVPDNKAVTIYNPCDGDLLKKKALIHADSVSVLSDHSVVTIGRLEQQKGQWHLIRAFAEVIKTVHDAKLYILGEGSLGNKLKQLTHELGLDEHIIFLGFIEAPHAYVMMSRVFVFPSLYEGLGNALLEAMACGTPCIATDCYSGPREILAPGTKVIANLRDIEYADYGILTAVGDKEHFNATEPLTKDEKQLAKAMVVLLQNDDIYQTYKEKGLKRIKDFLPEKIAESWKSLIENC